MDHGRLMKIAGMIGRAETTADLILKIDTEFIAANVYEDGTIGDLSKARTALLRMAEAGRKVIRDEVDRARRHWEV